MKRGLRKEVMVNLLKHPAEVFYKDDSITVVKPETVESMSYHLYNANEPKAVYSKKHHDILKLGDNDGADQYVVYTYKNTRFLAVNVERSWRSRMLQFRYTKMSDEKLIEMYPSLKKAFDKVARELFDLQLIENQDDEIVSAALRQDASSIVYVRNLTAKRKVKLLGEFPDTFEYMDQTPDLVRFAMENTDNGLGQVSPHLCSAGVCKAAIRKNPTDIQYVPDRNKTKELLLLAVTRDPRALSYITHHTMDLYVAAAKSGKNAWDYIPSSMKKAIKKAM